MRNDATNPDPPPEQLAAYVDGELDSAAAARVAAWLADDPAAAAEIDGQRRLLRLWQANPPPEPGPDAWAAVLAHIEEAKRPAAPRRPWRLSRPVWLGAGLAAAAVLAAVFLARFLVPGASQGDDEPLPVIGPGDVTILSMDGRDAAGLVGAAPPVQEILLASQEDVSVMNVQSFLDDDPSPYIGEGEVPMIVASAVAGPANR